MKYLKTIDGKVMKNKPSKNIYLLVQHIIVKPYRNVSTSPKVLYNINPSLFHVPSHHHTHINKTYMSFNVC